MLRIIYVNMVFVGSYLCSHFRWYLCLSQCLSWRCEARIYNMWEESTEGIFPGESGWSWSNIYKRKMGDVYEIYNRNLTTFRLVPPSIHHCLDPPCPPWEKKSPAWSIPDQIRDVRIFLSGLPRPRPLSSRWSYPGRGQITFEKIIENSEMGIWSLVSFSFSFVIKTLQTLDISPQKSFQFLRINFGNFMSKRFFYFVFIFFICLDFCLISFGSCYKDGLFPKAVHRQSPRVLARP